jgi:chemosensory pili system protein ChpA (sensor histidine kinase/response regulator)
VQAEVIDRLVNDAGELAISRSRIAMEIKALRLGMQELSDNLARLHRQLREIDIQAETKLQSRRMEPLPAAHAFDPLEFDRFTRLQELTRLMSESVEDIGSVRQTLNEAIDQTQQALEHQTRLTRAMQQGLMQVRMLQVGSIAGRLHRVVRQTAKEQGKSVNLEILGAAVQLDRSVLERITAPFEHLLRNAVVHGIELPGRRTAAGKTTTGEITISVSNTPNEVQVLVSDDGAGLDLQALRRRAVSEGRISVDQDLTDSELGKLIFLPGLSTAAELTQAAGRGVGLDVVRNEVLALGGRIAVASEQGRGTRFSIALPLTLSLMQAVLVRAGGLLYAIPAMMVEHIRHIPPADLQAARSEKKLPWQGRQLAYASLNSLLGWPGVAVAQSTLSVSADAGLHAKPQSDLHTDSHRITVLFLRSADQMLALEVEQMPGGSQEIVIKPIRPPLTRRAGISAATVMGSGEIGLIINPFLLLQGHQASEHSRHTAEPATTPDCVLEAGTETAASRLPTIMIVDDSITVRRITSRLLTRQGYKVTEARDGMAALNALQSVRELAPGSMPALLLVDIEMPRLDLPIIMISSRTAEKHRSHALQLGVNAFLGKPYLEQELLGHISALAFTRP